MWKTLVSTNCGGLVELIKNNINGYIVNKNNITGFSEKIYKLIVNKELRYKWEMKVIGDIINFFELKTCQKNMQNLYFHELSFIICKMVNK